jgi:hypothetical protein
MDISDGHVSRSNGSVTGGIGVTDWVVFTPERRDFAVFERARLPPIQARLKEK